MATDLCEAGQGVVAVAGGHGDGAVGALVRGAGGGGAEGGAGELLHVVGLLGAELEAAAETLPRPQRRVTLPHRPDTADM